MKKTKVIISISIIILLVTAITVYAYYSFSTSQDINATSDITKEEIKTIASYTDLFNNSYSSISNDSDEVSESTARKILRFSSNITLLADLTISNDVHIDLNGYTLDLNSYTLTISHGYSGVFSIYNGTIEANNGYIDINLVNAFAMVDNDTLIYKNNGISLETANFINIIAINNKYTAYYCYHMIASSISSLLNKKIELLNYNEVKKDTFNVNDPLNYLNVKKCCYSEDTNEACAFVYKDLDLPNHYLSSDIKIEYAFKEGESISNVISNNGIVNLPDTYTNVDLTVNLNIFEKSYSTTFKLHVVNLNNTNVNDNVSEVLIKNYLNKYYIDHGIIINSSMKLENYYYDLNHGIELPLNLFDGKITYSYKTYDYNNVNEVNTTSSINSNVLSFEPNDSCYHLKIEFKSKKVIDLQMYSTYIGNNESVARIITNRLYGGSIIYSSTIENYELLTLSLLQNGSDTEIKDYIFNYNITNIIYSLVDKHNESKQIGNAVEYYTIDSNNKLSITSLPEYTKCACVNARFEFTNESIKEYVDIELNIEYIIANDENVSGYLEYYNKAITYIDELTVTHDHDENGNEIIKNGFTMPFAFSNGAPYTIYDFAEVYEIEKYSDAKNNFNYYYNITYNKPSYLNVSLYFDGSDHIISYANGSSFTENFDSWLETSGQSLVSLASKNDIQWRFYLEPSEILESNTTVLLIYNYKFKGATTWTRYEASIITTDEFGSSSPTKYLTELNVSMLSVKGGVFYDTSSIKSNCIKDSIFFRWIYNSFNPGDDKLTESCDISQLIIPQDWLTIDIALDVTSNETLNSVSDFSGIGNLKYVSTVNLSGKTLSASHLTSISQMERVLDLNISNCNIDDSSDATIMNGIFSMNSVKVLDISKNLIKSFDGITNMSSLEVVYLYSQTNSDKSNYGSQGICNYQTFYDLLRNGCQVYNYVSNDVPIIFADTTDVNDYKRLKSITYQDRLKNGISITNLYANDRLNNISVNDFKLVNTGGKFTWGYEGDSNEGTKYMEADVVAGDTKNGTYYELIDDSYVETQDTTFLEDKIYYELITDTNARYFYVKYEYSGNILLVKYYVERY